MNPWNYLIVIVFTALLVWFMLCDQNERDERRRRRQP
jgi:hypothetical protein